MHRENGKEYGNHYNVGVILGLYYRGYIGIMELMETTIMGYMWIKGNIIGVLLGLYYRGYIGIMEEKMEAIIIGNKGICSLSI